MKTLVDIEEDLLAAAAAELGTTTKKDTVNEALRFVAGRRQRVQERIEGVDLPRTFGVGSDITDPEVMQQARR
jgi:hypothetical protein